jgi:hypothetical protein
MAESEDYAQAGRARGGEKLEEWEIKAARVSTAQGGSPQAPTVEPSGGSPRLMIGMSFGERVMNNFSLRIKTCLAGLCLAVLAATVIDVPPVEAQTYIAQPRPRARITVEPRSFLDAGTEVLPGERKFTDYAFPAGSYSMPLSVVQSTGGRVGWHQSPLPGPFDLPSRYNPYGW